MQSVGSPMPRFNNFLPAVYITAIVHCYAISQEALPCVLSRTWL